MKKLYIYATAALAIATIAPAIASAQTMMDVEGSAAINASVDAGQVPPTQMPANIRDRIRADIQTRMENADNNQNYRNRMLDERSSTSTRPEFASSTRGMRPMPVREQGGRFGSSTMMGSTTLSREDMGEGRAMMIRLFRGRKDNAVRQLQTALNNLVQIRTRINTRIQTEQQNGRDMSKAVSLLATADSQIASATAALNALTTYTPSSDTASSTVSASTTVDLATVRQLMTNAQTAIKNSQKALNAVVIAIAHSMGLKIGQDGTIVATSTASTTTTVTVTSTTTASTTNQ